MFFFLKEVTFEMQMVALYTQKVEKKKNHFWNDKQNTLVLDYAYHLAASDITSEQQQKKKIKKCQYCERKAKLLSLSALTISEKKKTGFGFCCFALFFCIFKKHNSLTGAGSRQKQDSQAHKVAIGPIQIKILWKLLSIKEFVIQATIFLATPKICGSFQLIIS